MAKKLSEQPIPEEWQKKIDVILDDDRYVFLASGNHPTVGKLSFLLGVKYAEEFFVPDWIAEVGEDNVDVAESGSLTPDQADDIQGWKKWIKKETKDHCESLTEKMGDICDVMYEFLDGATLPSRGDYIREKRKGDNG